LSANLTASLAVGLVNPAATCAREIVAGFLPISTQYSTNARMVFGSARDKCGHGHIVNISSIGGLTTFPAVGFYHMVKFAVEGCPKRWPRNLLLLASA
jgi:NAD(P)-dependent dehydrogenase (short-subunit alcohol dehydrogenase family)